ncbi:ribosomal protein S7e [Rhizoclosmatium globosum]|uniref:40S ribosomal protein S7 n=1 Tax=Rhizoclosmatium globosum TaxID=329046 RepID=A0A1Y2CLP0_9FUNG|nr:40S ribosomal protein [Rhizoclosmatium hyalinum]KAJ3282351.1 40S ribosomal protein [Rhizoclosmatium sp. JEL0117]ORY47784.1 ribosomal protein S7e [Rhizoclosmatium globosum]|eukprot:ORY47784.1 ribosomal protein S7e [Rhizoclosmatium globosum]
MSAHQKIVKPVGQVPDELELQVAQSIFDLEQNVAELKGDLRGLQFVSAKEVEIGHGKKAIVILVPVPLLKAFHKVQTRLVRELEKKFSDRHVLFIAHRRIMRKPTRRARVTQMRPRSRTLTAVHEKILEDLVYPTEIVGKRTKVRVDGSKLIKVFLDRKDHTALEYKLDTFTATYKKLTGKDVVFEFPVASSQE